MTEDLRRFTTDARGRIVVETEHDGDRPQIPSGCCCRNKHENLDGYIYTDPGCKLHGMKSYIPNKQSLAMEKINEEREAKRSELLKLMAAERRQTADRQLSRSLN